MGKKDLLANGMEAARLWPLLRHLPVDGGPQLRILAYHRVFDIAEEAAFPYDPELVSAGIVAFRQQVQHLAEHFTPVRLDEVVAAVTGSGRLPPRGVLITFDDGHADNYTHAFPVLRHAGVPATIFLSTGYMDGPATFWFDRVACLLYRCQDRELRVPGLDGTLVLTDVPSRRRAAGVLLEHLKVVPDAQRRKSLAWLQSTLVIETADEDRQMSGALTWGQVREMAGAGIDFGSHSVSHPILSQLDDDALDWELAESRREIAAQIGRPVDVIAYPVGGARAFDARVTDAVKRAGYRLGLSYLAGTNRLTDLDRYAMRRLHVERYTSMPMFRAQLELPRVFS